MYDITESDRCRKQEEEQSIAMIYEYDIETLPNDLVDMINEKNKREK